MLKRKSIWAGALASIATILFIPSVYAATTGTTKFSVDVENTALELTVPATPAVIDLNPTMTGASFGSTNVTVKVATNNITGYQLTMTPTNSQTNTSLIRTELVGSESTYREIETLDLTDPVSTGYPEEDFTANKWGYKITGDNYYGIDPNNTTVSHPTWITNEPTNGTNHNLTLAAKVDTETVSGAYETTLNFRAVTNAVVAKDTITFNGNGADSGDMSGDGFVVTSGNSTTLPTNAYTKSGYAFLGWNTAQNGSGMSYANEGTYTAISTDYSHNITLYAMWMDTSSGIYNVLHPGGSGLSGGITISRAYEIAYTNAGKGMWERDEGDRDNDGDTSEYYQVTDGVYHNYDVRWDMQGMTPEICDSVTVLDDSYAAIDIRDFSQYNIAKLQDGRCWMQDNLALDAVETKNNLSPLNTNAIQAAIDNFIANSGTAPQDGWATTAISYETNSSVYNQPRINISSKDVIPSDSLSTDGRWKVGIYYNYCAASIGTYCYNSVSGIDTDTASAIDVKNDICPANWRIPTGGYYNASTAPDGGEFNALYSAYPGIYNGDSQYTRVRKAMHLPKSGRFLDGSPSYQGSNAYIWSSTRWAEGAMYVLADERILDPWMIVARFYGTSVRCIAK